MRQFHLAAVLTAAALIAACPAPPKPGPGKKPECTTSADCPDAVEPSLSLGGLCTGGKCGPCATDDDCSADTVYGSDAVCIDGRCTVCSPGEIGCACLDGQYCLEGQGCQDGLCHACDAGDALCPCSADADCPNADTCSTDHRCVATGCTDGAEGCDCRADGCDAGLTCGDGTCRACPVDVVGCPCDADGACSRDLVCDATVGCRAATVCTELSCGTARLCAVANGVASCLDDCADGFTYDAASDSCQAIPGANCNAGATGSILASCTTQHRACVASAGTAACGACLASGSDCFVGPADPAQGTCVPPTTCADTCDPAHRDCTPNAGCGDVTCTLCVDGFFDRLGTCEQIQHVADCTTCDGVHRECLSDSGGNFCGNCATHYSEDIDGTCVGVDNCEAGADNSILDRCTALNRSCIEAVGNAPAVCGDCPQDTVEDPTSHICVALGACSQRSDCQEQDGFYCTQLSVQDDPQCRPAPCGPGETWDRFNQRCEVCGLTCADNTSGLWPVSDRNGNCLCATNDGFFWDASASSGEAVECDKDQDGWDNEKIFQVFSASKRSFGALRDDWSLILSVNCPVNEIDTFVLFNEWGQRLQLDVTSLGASGPVQMFETTRDDRDDNHVLPVDPAVVNTLTKRCNSPLDDFNDNGSADFSESQLATTGRSWQVFFNQFSYFMELYSGGYNPNTRQYFIAELTRSDTGFPFHYFANQTDDGDNWRCCQRRRDKNYNSADTTGYDFANFDCDQQDGACSYTWPAQWDRSGPQSTFPPATADLPDSTIPDYNTCSFTRDAPVGDVWRGMTHYSQFKCAQVVNVPASTPVTTSQVRLVDIYDGPLDPHDVSYEDDPRPYEMETCTLNVDGSVLCTPTGDAAAISASANNIRWLLRKEDQTYQYSPGVVDDYTGGCMDDFKEMEELCPGFVENPQSVDGDGDNGDFGKLECGCGLQYGGDGCDLPCANSSELHTSGVYNTVSRQGFWSCIDPVGSGFSPGTVAFTGAGGTGGSEVFAVEAAVPGTANNTNTLSQSNPPACGGPVCGFSVH